MSRSTEDRWEQACAVPYRRQNGQPEFCLITTSQNKRWGFPKGIIESRQTALEAALAEAQEEAGLQGVIEGTALGEYEYFKWGRTLRVRAFLMRVIAAADDWEEADRRDRRWCTAEEARRRIDRPALRTLLDSALARLGPPDDTSPKR